MSFAKRGVGAKGFFWEGADKEGGEGVILDVFRGCRPHAGPDAGWGRSG